MTKWTKKDVRYLCDRLMTWWLENRGAVGALERGAAMLATHRQDIVLSGLRGERERFSASYTQKCGTIGNAFVRGLWTFPGEDFNRFKALAHEDDQKRARAEALVHRVLAEGLPPEVVAFVPWE